MSTDFLRVFAVATLRFCARHTTHCISSFSPLGMAIRAHGMQSATTGRRCSPKNPVADQSTRTALIDPIRVGLANGWHAIDAATLADSITLEADAVIVGTGAGGGVTADILADAGLRVILVEEGPLRSSSDFRMREADAYPELYQESAARRTKDKAIAILQGRCVGG